MYARHMLSLDIAFEKKNQMKKNMQAETKQDNASPWQEGHIRFWNWSYQHL